MIAISEDHYHHLAQLLLHAIWNADFFNGTIEFNDEECRSELRVTLIICRRLTRDPADKTWESTCITDVIPVWWEHHLEAPEGELLTDFEWKEFKKYLI